MLIRATRAEPGLKGGSRALTASFLGALNNTIGLSLNNFGALNDRAANALVDRFLYGILAPGAGLASAGEEDDGVIPIGR